MQKHITRLGEEIRALVWSSLEISYYSRGAWSRDSVLLMSHAEREMAVEFINQRLEVAKKSPFPIY